MVMDYVRAVTEGVSRALSRREVEANSAADGATDHLAAVRRLIEGSEALISYPRTSQYSTGGNGAASCGLAAMNCVKYFLTKANELEGFPAEDVLGHLVSREAVEEILSICKEWRTRFHLDVEDLYGIPFFSNALEQVHVSQGRPGAQEFHTLLREQLVQSKTSAAIVITRPPEILCCVKLGLSAKRPFFIIFDSHPRPSHPHGSGLIMSSSIHDIASHLAQLFEFDPRLLRDKNMGWETQLFAVYSAHVFRLKEKEAGPQAILPSLESSLATLQLRAEKSDLEATNAQSQTTIGDLKRQIEHLQDENRSLRMEAAEIPTLQRRVVELTQENARLKRSAEIRRPGMTTYSSTVAGDFHRGSDPDLDLAIQHSRLTAEDDQLRKKINDLESVTFKLSADCQRFEKEIAKLKQGLATVTAPTTAERARNGHSEPSGSSDISSRGEKSLQTSVTENSHLPDPLPFRSRPGRVLDDDATADNRRSNGQKPSKDISNISSVLPQGTSAAVLGLVDAGETLQLSENKDKALLLQTQATPVPQRRRGEKTHSADRPAQLSVYADIPLTDARGVQDSHIGSLPLPKELYHASQTLTEASLVRRSSHQSTPLPQEPHHSDRAFETPTDAPHVRDSNDESVPLPQELFSHTSEALTEVPRVRDSSYEPVLLPQKSHHSDRAFEPPTDAPHVRDSNDESVPLPQELFSHTLEALTEVPRVRDSSYEPVLLPQESHHSGRAFETPTDAPHVQDSSDESMPLPQELSSTFEAPTEVLRVRDSSHEPVLLPQKPHQPDHAPQILPQESHQSDPASEILPEESHQSGPSETVTEAFRTPESSYKSVPPSQELRQSNHISETFSEGQPEQDSSSGLMLLLQESDFASETMTEPPPYSPHIAPEVDEDVAGTPLALPLPVASNGRDLEPITPLLRRGHSAGKRPMRAMTDSALHTQDDELFAIQKQQEFDEEDARLRAEAALISHRETNSERFAEIATIHQILPQTNSHKSYSADAGPSCVKLEDVPVAMTDSRLVVSSDGWWDHAMPPSVAANGSTTWDAQMLYAVSQGPFTDEPMEADAFHSPVPSPAKPKDLEAIVNAMEMRRELNIGALDNNASPLPSEQQQLNEAHETLMNVLNTINTTFSVGLLRSGSDGDIGLKPLPLLPRSRSSSGASMANIPMLDTQAEEDESLLMALRLQQEYDEEDRTLRAFVASMVGDPFMQDNYEDEPQLLAKEPFNKASQFKEEFDEESKHMQEERDLMLQFGKSAFKCRICFEIHPTDDVARIDGCVHTFCRNCLRSYISSELQARRFPIFCPSCKADPLINQSCTITSFLAEQLGIAENEFGLWTELELSRVSFTVTCRKCKRQAWVDRDEHNSLKMIPCPFGDCGHTWCKACLQTVEGGDHSCDGSKELDRLVSQQGWKRCPGCQIPVMKSDGCNHMTCLAPGCNTHFCYQCGGMIGQSGKAIKNLMESHYSKCKLFHY